MALTAAAAVALAAALDLTVGEPPGRLHPVAWFGRAVAPVDRAWGRPLAAGTAAALALPLAAAAAVAGVVAGGALVHPWLGAAVAGLALFSTSSLRMLLAEVRAVGGLAGEDLPAARERLPSLAGRDAGALSAGQVRSAAVESAAENLADGLVAPLSYFAAGAALGGLVAGPPGRPVTAALPLALGAGGAAWVKAVNTMDSMLGYRSKAVGTPAARLDDLVMYPPARATAALLALSAGRPGSLAAARRWAGRPSSPNAGWPMATAAALLAVRLEKPGAYVLNEAADLPDGAAVERAAGLTRRAGLLAYALAAVLAWLPATLLGGSLA